MVQLLPMMEDEGIIPRESKALERKHLARKERGTRKGSWKADRRGDMRWTGAR